MKRQAINTLTKRLREGIVLKAEHNAEAGGTAIMHDFDATKALMEEAALVIESMAWRLSVSEHGLKP